jgi:hypothetical protein
MDVGDLADVGSYTVATRDWPMADDDCRRPAAWRPQRV